MRRSIVFLFCMFSFLLAVLVCCAPKVTTKVDSTKWVKATKSISINFSSDYKDLKQIGTIEKGDESKVEGVYGDYVKVTCEDRMGWMYVEFLDFVVGSEVKIDSEYTVKNKVGASLLEGPSKNTKMIGAVKFGEKVNIIDVKPTWYKGTFKTENGDRTGWVYDGNVIVYTKTITNYITNK